MYCWTSWFDKLWLWCQMLGKCISGIRISKILLGRTQTPRMGFATSVLAGSGSTRHGLPPLQAKNPSYAPGSLAFSIQRNARSVRNGWKKRVRSNRNERKKSSLRNERRWCDGQNARSLRPSRSLRCVVVCVHCVGWKPRFTSQRKESAP